MRYPVSLTIAGSDSGGCAGIQADLKTFSAFGVFGTSVITAITAQNTREVRGVENLSHDLVKLQGETVLDDITVDSVKTGMLPTAEIIETVAELIDRYQLKNVVVHPVMIATTGASLAESTIAEAFRKFLFPRAALFTPNIPEAEALSGVALRSESDFAQAAEVMLAQGCRAVLIKGGHLLATDESRDLFFRQGEETLVFQSPRVDSINLHGTGCTCSAAIAACLALGKDMETSIGEAKNYITTAIEAGKICVTGKGFGPVNHFFNPQKLQMV